MKPILYSAVCLALLAPATLAGNVLVVDASGGGSYTTIQAAVDAAGIGDTILVKRGSYAAFTIDDKSVSVIADSGQIVRINGRVRVLDLAASRDVLLAGLNVRGPAYSQYTHHVALDVLSNAGSVRVEDCNLEGFVCGQGSCLSGDAIVVVASQDVSFARCALRGGEGGWGGSGANLHTSRTALYDSTVEGGSSSDGIGGASCERPDGGNGVYLWSQCFLFASGSVFQGGDGGIGEGAGTLGCSCGPGSGDGGSGVIVAPSSSAALLDIAAFGGQGGAGDPSCPWCCTPPFFGCCPGYDGGAITGPGVVTAFPGPSRHLEIPNPQRELVSAPIEIRGEPGDDVYLYLSRRTSFRFVPGFRGVQLTQQPGPPLHLGVVPPSGTLTAQFPLPDLGPGVQSRLYYFQTAHRDAQGVWTYGSPVSLVVLDQAF